MISIIIPVQNEVQNLKELRERLLIVAATLKQDWEIIFVDDHSTDGSGKVLSEFCRQQGKLKTIRLAKNFGQTLAIQAGIDHSKGDILIFLDADLQNDPADITKLLDKMKEGYDVVSGWRKNRKDPLFAKRIPSVLGNIFISFLFKIKLHDIGCTLKAYRKEVISHIRLYGEMHRILPLYALMRGARITEVEISHNPRIAGRTHYGLSRIFKVCLDLITVRVFSSYSTKPIYFFGGTGIIFLILGNTVGLAVIIRKILFRGTWVSPLLFISLMFGTVGLQLIFMGILAELIIRIYHESHSEKAYLISKIFPEERLN